MFALVAAILAALLIASTVFAAFFTINTNDGLDDPNWPVSPFTTDPTGDAPSNYDIQSFWAGTDANPPNNYYFRADLVGTLSMAIDDYLFSRLDCNDNGSMADSVDVLIGYVPETDTLLVAQGDLTNLDSMPGSSLGEVTSSGNYEWRVPTSGGSVDWSACETGHIKIDLVTVDNDYFGGIQDQTTSHGFNVPTAVTLRSLSAGIQQRASTAMLVLASIGLGSAGILVLRRRRGE
jgi:hypothetical protein